MDRIQVQGFRSLGQVELACGSAVLSGHAHLQVLLGGRGYNLAQQDVYKRQVCGYVYEGEQAPEKCPQCGVPASKFKLQDSEGMAWACEHEVGVAQGSPEDIMMDLRANFEGECSEVGMYLAMSRVAHREGYPEIGLYWEKAAFEEAEHAAKFAELLGEVVTSSTKKNLEMRVAAENGATAGKFDLAKSCLLYTSHDLGLSHTGRTYEQNRPLPDGRNGIFPILIL